MARASLPLLLLAALACSVLLATPVAVAHTIKHIVVLMQEVHGPRLLTEIRTNPPTRTAALTTSSVA